MKLLTMGILMSFAASAFSNDCPEGMLTGKFIFPDDTAGEILADGTIKDNLWKDFYLMDPDHERPEGGQLSILRNIPFEMEQVGCDTLVVNHQKLANSWFGAGRTRDHIKPAREEIALASLGETLDGEATNEKAVWSKNSLTFSSKVGNFIGWRKYKIEITKNEDGSIDVKYNGSGFAPIPAPIPVYWKNSYKLIPVK
jgi:hypothetical protein